MILAIFIFGFAFTFKILTPESRTLEELVSYYGGG